MGEAPKLGVKMLEAKMERQKYKKTSKQSSLLA
jgi:hypothetical protein